ncbi:hypothetical protein HGRIS_012505 [Hohenbuehelia grisea]|uniref:DUF6534 domain-containing protein n=1 Tax=Hohenbuehelia grisea TaxID=104357 RepID=A0ABR3ISI1_9AGAR
MARLDEVLGSLLIGSFVNNVLFALEILAVLHFFRHPRNGDTLLLKGIILVTFLSDTLCTVAACAAVYLYTVTHWGEADYIQKQYWPLTTVVSCTALTALLVQSFLVSRYSALTKNWIVTAVLAVLILACFSGTIGTAVSIVTFSEVAQRHKAKVVAIIWLSTSAATDVGIACALVHQLLKMKSAFPKTSSTIHRLILGAVQTGTVPCILALASLITYLAHIQSNVPGAFAFCIGRVYALTMLYNLNFRTAFRRESVSFTSSRGPADSTTMTGVCFAPPSDVTQETTFHSSSHSSPRSVSIS